MVFTKFSVSSLSKAVKITALASLLAPISFAFSHTDTGTSEPRHTQELQQLQSAASAVEYQWPVYAAQLSDDVTEQCVNTQCELNLLNADDLSAILSQHPLSDELFDAFSLSEYELLVSSARIDNEDKDAELLLELTTSWRGVPIDDINIILPLGAQSVLQISREAMDTWITRAQDEGVFSAERIYSVIGASDYHQQMVLPEKIGDFVILETALYHDPMLGSITRYTHPDFADAVVDVSVYPVSPFIHKQTNGQAPLEAEMEIEKSHIQTLIAEAKLQDYFISEVQRTELDIGAEHLSGLSIEVALQTNIDPIYSTQFLFAQNDKFIKLTGNVPKHMMLGLVQESIGHIRVPSESEFMQLMRQ